MSVPPTRRALTVLGHRSAAITTRPIPALRPDYILIRVSAVALNPADWQTLASSHGETPSPNTVLGFDYSGIVVALGPGPLTRSFEIGDRVAGLVRGNEKRYPEDGAFAEYIVAKTGLSFRVPRGWEGRMSEAATLGVGVATVGQALFQGLGLRWPDGREGVNRGKALLIYGGSTATGSVAIQLAKLSGLEVVTTCSPRNFDLVKGLGADAVFDYRSPSCGKDINAYTNNQLVYAFDCISVAGSVKICCEALSSSPPAKFKPQYTTLLDVLDETEGPGVPRDDIDVKFTLAHSVNGEEFDLGDEVVLKPEDYVWASRFLGCIEKLLEDGQLKAHPQEKRSGGLDGIFDGLKELESGNVSGAKLVYEF